MVKTYEISQKGDSKFLKKVNEARILNMIRNDDSISRVEISKRARMSKAGVSEIISRLMDDHFIMEKGKGISTNRGGKRPTILEINPEGGFVFGIHIEKTRCHVVIANIKGEFIDREMLKYPISEAIDTALPEICRFMETLMEKNKLSPKRLISIGIAIPGLVDRQKGDLIIAYTEGWAHKPFIEFFQNRFDVPVILENDVNALSLAEFYYGAGQNHSDMACLHFGDGIGAGIIENDELVSGIYGGAGEVGYMNYRPCTGDENFFLLQQGQPRFGRIFGMPNLVASLKIACNHYNFTPDLPIDENNYFDILKNADPDQNEAFSKYFEQFSRILSGLCANMIIILNPSLFVLSGPIFHCSEALNTRVTEDVKAILDMTPLKNMTDIQIGSLESQEVLIGIVEIALGVLYKPNIDKNFIKE